MASNREPYIHEYSGKKIKCVQAISGLTIALDPVMQASGGIWVAYGSGDADKDTVDKNNKIRVPPENPSYTLKRIWMTKEEVNGYYYGYANCALWPLAHIAYEKPLFDAFDWGYYETVNRRFAQNILKEISNGKSFVWLQDYHLTLTAKYIKEKRPDAVISLFWHIPWPNPEVFRVCPQKKEILEGLLSNDLLGFHIRYHCHNFLSTIELELEAKVDWEELSVVHQGHKTLVRPFPISVDYEGISTGAKSVEVEKAMQGISDSIDPPYEILIIGIDRVDYTKGIIERLKAVERFLEKYPQYHGRFVFLQMGALSRIHIKSYKLLIDNIQALAEEINWKYGEGSWYPIVVKNIRLDYTSHLALYRAADLCLVSSLHDGMNLVAKEFIAASVDKKGVLILSQFTGAARDFAKEAILVNPYDSEGFADALHMALELSPKEKRERMERMQQILAENNIYRWAGKFISNLLKLE
ncbi:MAG: trehalose-6-phosphate synthase [Candidatus Omnitrophica bacterium]|nr:trehalose-6-phosphate synthase [Candidatus Omnitrophota bacterium]